MLPVSLVNLTESALALLLSLAFLLPAGGLQAVELQDLNIFSEIGGYGQGLTLAMLERQPEARLRQLQISSGLVAVIFMYSYSYSY
jgi:hypothetical protein